MPESRTQRLASIMAFQEAAKGAASLYQARFSEFQVALLQGRSDEDIEKARSLTIAAFEQYLDQYAISVKGLRDGYQKG